MIQYFVIIFCHNTVLRPYVVTYLQDCFMHLYIFFEITYIHTMYTHTFSHFTDEDINFRYATALFRGGKNHQAIKVLQCCQKLKCKELSDTIKTYCIDRWHFSMLNDRYVS